jgi:hypothetical protein
MDPVVLDRIPFRVDLPQLLKAVHLGADGEDAPRVMELAQAAEAVARPKAIYRAAYIESKGEESVVIEGIAFKSRVLRVNLDGVHRVFPYVATCGMELEQWSASLNGMLEQSWGDAIKRTALNAAFAAVGQHIEERFHLGKTARMNPGSLEDWPLSEQRPLWELLGDPTKQIGVTLKDSFLMSPIKSVSGIVFPTEVTYENCQLCARERCPGRRAPYDRALYERKYRKAATQEPTSARA